MTDKKKGKDKKLTILVPEELHRAAKIKAAETGTPIAEICRKALAEWIGTGDPQPKEAATEVP
jgi:predicted HicB family RNase H-like nuclease